MAAPLGHHQTRAGKRSLPRGASTHRTGKERPFGTADKLGISSILAWHRCPRRSRRSVGLATDRRLASLGARDVLQYGGTAALEPHRRRGPLAFARGLPRGALLRIWHDR